MPAQGARVEERQKVTKLYAYFLVIPLCFVELEAEVLLEGRFLVRNRLEAHAHRMSSCVDVRNSWLPCKALGPDGQGGVQLSLLQAARFDWNLS